MFAGGDVVVAPLTGTVAIIFGFFVGFGGADMRERSRELRLVSQREANEARSILKFAEGAGVLAEPLRQALIEYLQAATTPEQDWIKARSRSAPPGQPMADSLVLFATLFAMQVKHSDTVNSLIVTNVDHLRQARITRLNLSLQSSSLAEWIAMTVLVLIIQGMIAMTHVGKRRATLAGLMAFSLAAASVYIYLAWIDGLIGSSRIALSIGPLKEVLDSIVY